MGWPSTAVVGVAAGGFFTLASACTNEAQRGSPSDDTSRLTTTNTSARSAACQACVLEDAPDCRAAYDACIGNVKCHRAALCELERGCLASAATDRACLRLCSGDGGIRVLTDPAFQLVLKLNACAHARCGPACGAG